MPTKKSHSNRNSRREETSGPRAIRSDGERRLRQADRLARVLRLLDLIQGNGRHNLATLATELECSTRTIRRQLDVLELAGVPFYLDREQGRYRMQPGYRFPTLSLTDEELLGQAIATSLASCPALGIATGARPTTRKLAATLGEEAASILDLARSLTVVVDLKLAAHDLHREMIRSVQWALLRGRQLAGRYATPHRSRSRELTIHPYRLCLLEKAWYLVARPDGVREPRSYRVARFESLRILDAPSLVPPTFDLKAYFGDAWCVFRGGRQFEVELLFDREAASVVTETDWHHTQDVRRHADGTATLLFRVDGLEEVAPWVLGWTGRVRVVRPPELRLLVLERWRSAIEVNSDGG